METVIIDLLSDDDDAEDEKVLLVPSLFSSSFSTVDDDDESDDVLVVLESSSEDENDQESNEDDFLYIPVFPKPKSSLAPPSHKKQHLDQFPPIPSTIPLTTTTTTARPTTNIKATKTTTAQAERAEARVLKQQAKLDAQLLKQEEKLKQSIQAGKYKEMEVVTWTSSAFAQGPISPLVRFWMEENKRTLSMSTLPIQHELVWFTRHALTHDHHTVKRSDSASTVEGLALLFVQGDLLCGMVDQDMFISQVLDSKHKANLPHTIPVLFVVLDLDGSLRRAVDPSKKRVVDDFLLRLSLTPGLGGGHVHVKSHLDAMETVSNHLLALELFAYKFGKPVDFLNLTVKLRSYGLEEDRPPRNPTVLEPERKKHIWGNQLQSVPRVSANVADEIVRAFPSCVHMFKAFERDPDGTEQTLYGVRGPQQRKEIKMAKMLRSVFTSMDPHAAVVE